MTTTQAVQAPVAAPAQAGNVHRLTGSAIPAAIAYHPDDKTIWFVTPDAELGSFTPSGLYESRIFPPVQTGRKAGTLAVAGTTVWTYATDAAAGHVVACTAEGKYTDKQKLDTAASATAMAAGDNGHGDARIVCTRDGRSDLVLINTASAATSEPYAHPLYGLAIGTKSPAIYWVSCPEAKSVLSYSAEHGDFGKPITLPDNKVPQHLAITENGHSGFLWIATQQQEILRYDLDDKSFAPVGTTGVVGRLFPMADGSVWFTLPSADALGYILPGRTDARYVPLGKGSRPSGITADGQGRLWAGLAGTGEMALLSEYRMAVVSGEDQSAHIGATFPDRLAVKVTTLDGTAHLKATVTFTIRDDQVRFADGQPTATKSTGKDGVATSPALVAKKAGAEPCDVVAEWKEESLLVPFGAITVIPDPGPADHLVYVSGAGQQAPPGEDFPQPLVVKVADEFGTPVPEVDVTFRVTDDMASFAGDATAVITSDADGSATSPVLSAGGETGRAVVEVWGKDASAGIALHEYVRDAN
ncbi:hypothetical protein AB0D16_18610 [Streptomyces sp. NPDC048161]|uniref:hypothetical protein n=1 Tax=Streptomyces sp. NPDC048161 TaxID=3160985 RepID=UPI0033E4D59B